MSGAARLNRSSNRPSLIHRFLKEYSLTVLLTSLTRFSHSARFFLFSVNIDLTKERVITFRPNFLLRKTHT